MGSPYSAFPPYPPYTGHPSAQMMMTPPTPNTGNTFQNPSPYMMHSLPDSGNATPEIFSNGIGSGLNSSIPSPIVNESGPPSHQPQGKPLPRMNQLPIGLNIHNVHPEGDENWSRPRIDSYNSGNPYGTEESPGYQQHHTMSNSGFNSYDQGNMKTSVDSMTSDRFGTQEGMNYPQTMSNSYHSQDYSNQMYWPSQHSSGYPQDSSRPLPPQHSQTHPYTYSSHENK
ncbi:hypothetical protein K7432_006649 [Basidiobolus ranarum]|uniref:Uncharacterized protein n=1 Tax=Basidiobolus ranarum TaxID=34480 RepID=A0ABR2W198_9FUNG